MITMVCSYGAGRLRSRSAKIQLQPHPPPQQLPPPPENPPDDLAEGPLLDPFAELNTES
jgi:hypothetical protein